MMEVRMKFRWIVMVVIIVGALLIAGYRLAQSEPDIVTAAPAIAPVKEPISVQATTIEEVMARGVLPASDQPMMVENEVFGYHISYPHNWNRVNVSTNVVTFQSSQSGTEVTVETGGPLPADGLAAFVDRNLGNHMVISRQLLTIHSLPAERIIVYSTETQGQETIFFIESDASVYIISGVGEQKLIEMVARSFSNPQLVAQR